MVRSDMLPQPDRGLGLDRPQTEAFHRRVQEEDSRSPQRRTAQARRHGRVRPRQEHRGEAGQVDKRDRLAARRRQPHARVEPDPGARAREPQAPDGGRRLKTSGASIRSEVRAMAANGGPLPHIGAALASRPSDLCQDFGHASSRNQAAIGMASSLGSVLSKKAAMASAGTL